MWSKCRSIFQVRVNYIHNDTVNTFGLFIIHYSERVRDMHNLAKYLPPPSNEGCEYDKAYCTVRDK